MRLLAKKFINNPWPFAILAALCFIVALVQDNPFSMLMGYWSAAIAFANTGNRF